MEKFLRYVSLGVCFFVFLGLIGLPYVEAQKMVKVGVASFGKHPSLDACIDGFKEAMKEAGYVEGKNVEYEVLMAQFDMATSITVAQTLKNKPKDLIFSLCTPMSQAVVKQISDVPVVFGMVTDPVGAEIVKSEQRSGNNVTGATDRPDMKVQFALFKKLVPKLKRLGFPYNPAEANDAFQFNEAKEITKEMGMELVPAPASNSGEVKLAVQNLVGRVDGVYIPSSNVVNVAVGAVVKICSDNRIPLFGSDPQTVKDGAFASVGVSYFGVGRNAGLLAAKVLKGTKPTDLPILNPSQFETHLNLKAAKSQGVSVPEDVIKNATMVYQ